MGAGHGVKGKSQRQSPSGTFKQEVGRIGCLWCLWSQDRMLPFPTVPRPGSAADLPQSHECCLPALVGSESVLSTSGHPRWLCSPHTAQLTVLFMPQSMPMMSRSCAVCNLHNLLWQPHGIACAQFNTDPQKAEREDRREEEEKGRGRGRRQIRRHCFRFWPWTPWEPHAVLLHQMTQNQSPFS